MSALAAPRLLDEDFPRRRVVATAAAVATAVAGVSGALLAHDTGTRVSPRADLRSFATGTRLVSYAPTEGIMQPFVQPSRVDRILNLTGLSARRLAEALGVTHTTIADWRATDADREDLTRVLAVLEDARHYQADLGRWMTTPIPGMRITPFDLIKHKRWRALRGAARAKPASAPGLTPERLRTLRQQEVSWALAEPAVPSIDD
jgi:hypothetical protein